MSLGLQGQALAAVQRIIALLTIETISRGTKEITRLLPVLTVQGCYRMSDSEMIRMTVVELRKNPQVVGNVSNRRKKIGPPGENRELLILKKGNKAAVGTEYVLKCCEHKILGLLAKHWTGYNLQLFRRPD